MTDSHFRRWVADQGIGSESLPAGDSYLQSINGFEGVLASDDFKTRIENASVGTSFLLEPGASWTIDNPPVTFPDNHHIIAHNNRVIKGDDGDLAEIGDDSYIFGDLQFDGNKSAGHTGGGVVDAHNDAIRLWWLGVEIYDCAGDGRVHDGRSRASYPQCRFYNNDRHGLYETHSGTDAGATDTRCRRNRYDQTFISNNGDSGIFADTEVEETWYLPRVGANVGAGFEFDPDATNDYLEDVYFGGTWQNNDGPMFLQRGGQCRFVDHFAHLSGNVEDISATPFSGSITDPEGQVHFEDADSIDLYQISGGHMRTGGADADASISGQSGVIEHVNITGGGGPDADNIEGANMALKVADGFNWNMPKNVGSGTVYEPNETGDSAFIQNLHGATRLYLRATATPPGSDAPRSLYFDTGANTSSGNPAWRYDATGDGTYEAETN